MSNATSNSTEHVGMEEVAAEIVTDVSNPARRPHVPVVIERCKHGCIRTFRSAYHRERHEEEVKHATCQNCGKPYLVNRSHLCNLPEGKRKKSEELVQNTLKACRDLTSTSRKDTWWHRKAEILEKIFPPGENIPFADEASKAQWGACRDKNKIYSFTEEEVSEWMLGGNNQELPPVLVLRGRAGDVPSAAAMESKLASIYRVPGATLDVQDPSQEKAQAKPVPVDAVLDAVAGRQPGGGDVCSGLPFTLLDLKALALGSEQSRPKLLQMDRFNTIALLHNRLEVQAGVERTEAAAQAATDAAKAKAAQSTANRAKKAAKTKANRVSKTPSWQELQTTADEAQSKATASQLQLQAKTDQAAAASSDLLRSTSFSLFGQRCAFTGFHTDCPAGTWVRTLSGKKLWIFPTPCASTDDDLRKFAAVGDSWAPRKVRAVLLEAGDTLIMAEPTPHAVLTLEDSWMHGGMFVDVERMPALMEKLHWIACNQNVTNEPVPLELLRGWAHMRHLFATSVQGASAESQQRFAKLEAQLRAEIGCREMRRTGDAILGAAWKTRPWPVVPTMRSDARDTAQDGGRN
ncbi:hypothetical protein PWT90_07368 [Aphanocladium album]|nr:hypothetical protein PWT90_07368 [Aphanocladium album]